MNAIREDFSKDLKRFFMDLKAYLDTDIYFYGSSARNDYVHNKSDIDVAIFTDNEYSTMAKLQHYLHVGPNAFDKVVWKLFGKMIYGYKIKCDKFMDVKCEIAIYNMDFKENLIKEFYPIIPLYANILMYILKLFYYTIPVLPKHMYDKGKRLIFNTLIQYKTDSVFYTITNATVQ